MVKETGDGRSGTLPPPSGASLLCFPNQTNHHNKRLRKDEDRSTASTATAPATKKLFSIFHFSKTSKQQQQQQQQQKQQRSIVSSKPQSLRHHSSNSSSSNDGARGCTDASVSPAPRRIFIDLDGVLVDFDAGAQQLEHIHTQSKNPNKASKFNLWVAISRRQHFYRTLPWTVDGKELWNFLVSLSLSSTSSSSCDPLPQQQQPPPPPAAAIQLHILTGVPWNSNPAAVDKFHWCQRELQWTDPTSAATIPVPSSPSSSLGAAPTTGCPPHLSVTMESQLAQQNTQWHWKNMAAPKKAHARVNLAVPTSRTTAAVGTTSSTTDHVSGSSSSSSSSSDEYRPTVITCWSCNKSLECRRPGDVLIDDRPTNHDLQQKWENAGGLFIHHTSTQNTIQQLKEILFGTAPS